jgi:hypothetical protein
MPDLAQSHAAPVADWLEKGAALAALCRESDWALADWLSVGKATGYLSAAPCKVVSADIGIPLPWMRNAMRAAAAFPVGVRLPDLTVEHHAPLASMPRQEALEALRRAQSERLPAQAMRERATQYRYESGENFRDEDTDSTLATQAIRAWNRATPEARELAFEHFQLAAAKGHAIVDEDEMVDG